MEKFIKDNMVGVIISPNFGAGFSTWNNINPMDKDLVEAVLNNDEKRFFSILEERYGLGKDAIYFEDLDFEFVPKGTKFYIEEYDGAESIVTLDQIEFLEA